MQAFEQDAKRIRMLRTMLNRGVVKLIYKIEYNKHTANVLSYATTNIAFVDSEAWPDGAEDPTYDFISKNETAEHVLFFDYQRQMWVNVAEKDIICVFKKVATSVKEWASHSDDYRWEKSRDNGCGKYKLVPVVVHNNDAVTLPRSGNGIKWSRADVATDRRNQSKNILKEISEIEDEELMMLELYKLLRSFFMPMQESGYQSYSKKTMADTINEYIESNLKNREDCI